MKRAPIVTLIGLLLLFIQSASVGIAQAQKTFYWESFNVDIRLREDGTLDITEQQTIVFGGGTFSYGFATIDLNNLDAITNIEVREGDTVYDQVSVGGSPHTFTVEESADEVVINWYFPATSGHNNYTFSYTVEGAVRVEDTGSQVYWQAIPKELLGDVVSSDVTISVPEGVTILSTIAEVFIPDINDITTEVSEDQRRATFHTTNLLSGQGFDVGVRFPTEQLDLAPPQWQEAEILNDTYSLFTVLGSVGLFVGSILLVLGLWYMLGRDPEASFSAEYITAPPDDTPPAIVGTLIDEKADMHDILSTIVDLAHRGHIKIKEGKNTHTYIRQKNDADHLRPYEQALMNAIFGNSKKKSLNDLRYKFASNLPQLRDSLYDEIVTLGYFNRSPESTRQSYSCFGSVIICLSVVAAIGISNLLISIDTAYCLGLAFIPAGILMSFFAAHMPRKTRKGAEEAAQWEAFRQYLRNIEEYDGLQEADKIFESYLPYAVAFGIERNWISKFESLPQPVLRPIWYEPYPRRYRGRRGGMPVGTPGKGGGGSVPSLEGMSKGMTGGLEGMSQSFTRMLNSTSTTMKSVKPSSKRSGGSRGSFGGGFSGGSSGGGSRGFG